MNIRYRNIKRNNDNVIVSGSATLVENKYRPNANGKRTSNHTQQTVIERLGKVIWLDEDDNKNGIFDSPNRGLVAYSLQKDEFVPVDPTDPRLKGTRYQLQPDRIHTTFGNTYLFFSEMEKTPYMNVLREAFREPALYQRVLAHVAHDCLKNGSFIKCGEFLSENWLSYILKEIPYSTLDCDSAYYKRLSDDNLKKAFFTTLVKELRKSNPDFGRGCYVDSTPLPGEALNNPFNALCSHGTDGITIQSRLVLVLDIQTCIPIWFEIIPSNVLDKSTILSLTADVKATLDIDIDMYDLDAGYARQELFELFNRNNSVIIDDEEKKRDHTVLVRMPATPGYPRDELYIQCKPHFYGGKYSFDYEHHTFFGERIEVDLFGIPEYAFVYIDKTQAESLLRKWREEHLEEWNDLSESAQDWYMVKDGFFILIGNKDQSPKEALLEYRSRAQIESFFRDGKAYLNILPLSKWTKQTVKGKIFHDIIETIFYRAFRRNVSATGMSMSSLLVYLDSLECFKRNENLLELKTPRVQVREIFEKLGYAVPGHIDLKDLRDEVLHGISMDREPVTVRKKRAPRTAAPPISPEEKADARKQKRIEQAMAEAEQHLKKAEEKADRVLKRSIAQAKAKHNRVKERAERILLKKQAVSKRDSTKAKALKEYDQSVIKAGKEYDRVVAEVKETHNAALAEAKNEFERRKTSITVDSEI